jgi:hypothetical protein
MCAQCALAMSPSEQPKKKGEHHADDDARGQRKIEDSIFAPINNIAWQTPQRQIEPSGQQEHGPNQQNHAAQYQQSLAKISHSYILIGRANKNVAANQREKPNQNPELLIRAYLRAFAASSVSLFPVLIAQLCLLADQGNFLPLNKDVLYVSLHVQRIAIRDHYIAHLAYVE